MESVGASQSFTCRKYMQLIHHIPHITHLAGRKREGYRERERERERERDREKDRERERKREKEREIVRYRER